MTGATPFCDPAPYSAERFAYASRSGLASSAARPAKGKRSRLVDAARDGARHDVGGERAEFGHAARSDRRADARRSRREHDVAVERRVDRTQRARHAVLRHDGEAPGLRLGQRRVGRDHDQRGVLAGLPLVRNASACGGIGAGRPRPPNSPSRSNGAAQKCGPPPIMALPAALTAASAPTVMPSRVSAEAEPRPPLRSAVVAPRPAPTLPSAKSVAARGGRRDSRARDRADSGPSSCRRR